jgi:hypothetical protein
MLDTILEKGKVRRKRFKIKDMWEALEDAATNKKKCFIRYKKRGRGAGSGEYLVAPYSFRQKPGGEVLFAYDVVSGKTKSFFRDGITGVHVTDSGFRPKWDVEIAREYDMSVMDTFYELGVVIKAQSMDDFFKQGRAAERKITDADVDAEELERGAKVELEHTDDKETARRIALDHLAEFANYYVELAKMEQKLKEEGGGNGGVAEEKDATGEPPAAGTEATGSSPKPDVTKPRITVA